MPDKDYYIAAGRSLEVVQEYLVLAKAAHEHAQALSKEVGADGTFADSDQDLVGFVFKDPEAAPDYLREDRKTPGMFVPNRRKGAGRDLSDKMSQHRRMSRFGLTVELVGTVSMGAAGVGVSMSFAGFQHLDDDIVITVREGSPAPKDAVPLTRSEYWARREAQMGDQHAED